MNWLNKFLKLSRRKFMPQQQVRVLIEPRKGKGKVVLMPNYEKGEVLDFDSAKRRYIIKHQKGTSEAHPRNVLPDKS